LNEPRYASLPNIISEKKPIARQERRPITASISRPNLEILKTTNRPPKGGVKVKDVAELISKLKNEAGVL